MNSYRLAIDGDGLEKFFWDKFIQNEFPSYEKFWQIFVVPITNRPHDIHTKTDDELKKIGKSVHDICVAELHYSILRHLAKVYLLIYSEKRIGLDELTDGLVRLCGALDIADEFLERVKGPTEYDSWSEEDGEKARKKWRKQTGNKLQDIRGYRNHLIHGRLMPSVNGMMPKVGKQKNYLDWRKVTDPIQAQKLNIIDFATPKDILIESWGKALIYLESNWQKIL